MHTKDENFIEIKDHGFIAPVIERDHYILGAANEYANAPIINEKGNWNSYKPPAELQNKNGLETSNCSNYGTHNALETLGDFHKFDDFPSNLSERYSGVLTETTEQGNDPHKVIEKIRNEIGGIAEEMLPFGPDIDSWKKYYWPKPMQNAYINVGRKLITKFKIGHEWVFLLQGTPAQKAAKLEYALKRGTVCVSVLAWKRRGGLYWKDVGESDNHWCQLLRRNSNGTWRVYDHYDGYEKDLESGYDFGFAKVYYLRRYAPGEIPEKKSQLLAAGEALLALLKKLYQLLLPENKN